MSYLLRDQPDRTHGRPVPRQSSATPPTAMAGERERLTGQGVLPPRAVAAFRRGELRLEAELRWHEEFERGLAAPGARGRGLRVLGAAPASDGR
jgi:hypothetical protein